ncbi:MAG: MgtC/SapB family protein [Terriglobales bacterium]
MGLDLMRLPLGILTGMGFIGGRAILRRDGFVLGVTTAATLWFVTVMGLCFGGGQISLGIVAFLLGMLVLEGLRWFDYRVKQEQHGILNLKAERDQPTEEEIRATVRSSGCKITISSVSYLDQTQQREFEFRLVWRAVPQGAEAPSFLRVLLSNPHILAAQWKDS